ncbi:hypothetical protein CGRA01v4_00273 [Colletotrichum graminicola]|nr:hypothetical protein CGRA01v4_00273 [Colletotrichum graminicola]
MLAAGVRVGQAAGTTKSECLLTGLSSAGIRMPKA